MLRFLTAGESHGRGLVVIIEGLPAGLPLQPEEINADLCRRQQGYGRGGRMRIEQDRAEILSGVRYGLTLGSPITLLIQNHDWENWQKIMSPLPPEEEMVAGVVTQPRPGHADLAGGLKYRQADLRNILERSSARETAARVAAGAVARKFLSFFKVAVHSHVLGIGPVTARPHLLEEGEVPDEVYWTAVEESPVRCGDPVATRQMMAAIDAAAAAGDTLGGVFEVVATGLVPGLGSHIQWDRRLDGLLAQAVMSIPAVKGVEIGLGFAAAGRPGSQVHDEIFYAKGRGFYRRTNRAGGLEGGITNGEPLLIRGAMKPIPTLRQPLATVDIRTHQPARAAVERSDVCAVPAAAVVAEAMVCLVLAQATLEKFGGDSLEECLSNWRRYREGIGLDADGH